MFTEHVVLHPRRQPTRQRNGAAGLLTLERVRNPHTAFAFLGAVDLNPRPYAVRSRRKHEVTDLQPGNLLSTRPCVRGEVCHQLIDRVPLTNVIRHGRNLFGGERVVALKRRSAVSYQATRVPGARSCGIGARPSHRPHALLLRS